MILYKVAVLVPLKEGFKRNFSFLTESGVPVFLRMLIVTIVTLQSTRYHSYTSVYTLP